MNPSKMQEHMYFSVGKATLIGHISGQTCSTESAVNYPGFTDTPDVLWKVPEFEENQQIDGFLNEIVSEFCSTPYLYQYFRLILTL